MLSLDFCTARHSADSVEITVSLLQLRIRPPSHEANALRGRPQLRHQTPLSSRERNNSQSRIPQPENYIVDDLRLTDPPSTPPKPISTRPFSSTKGHSSSSTNR
ncbi:hypothetical protein RYX36_010186 [Vicia faba]